MLKNPTKSKAGNPMTSSLFSLVASDFVEVNSLAIAFRKVY